MQSNCASGQEKFAIDSVNFCRPLWRQAETRYIADQLCRASTSTASNYRAACRGRSKREFIAKLGTALEEADESLGWYEIIEGAQFATPSAVAPLLKEANDLVAILAASRITALGNNPDQ